MFTEKEMSDALKWLFDLFQPEDYEAYDEEEVGCAALCLPEVCMALRDKAETAYEYVVKTNIDRGFEYRGKELFMQRACLIYSDIEIGIYDMTDTSYNRELWLLEDMSFALVRSYTIPMFGVVLPLLPVLIVLDSSAGSSITAAMDGVSADKLRTGLKTSVILFRLLKQNQEI